VIRVEQLYEMLKKTQEAKGRYFNSDGKLVFELLGGLIVNKERYGYMSCPCRLASGNYEQDKDIICPCIYSGPDIEEFGSCYCGLYATREWSEGKIKHVYVPERRPQDKMTI